MPAASKPNVPYCGFGRADAASSGATAATAGEGGGGAWAAQAASAVVASAKQTVRSMNGPLLVRDTLEQSGRSVAKLNRRLAWLCLQTAEIQAFALRRRRQREPDQNRQTNVEVK